MFRAKNMYLEVPSAQADGAFQLPGWPLGGLGRAAADYTQLALLGWLRAVCPDVSEALGLAAAR